LLLGLLGFLVFGLFLTFFIFTLGQVILESRSLLFMIDREIAVLADTLSVESSVGVLAFCSFLGPTLRVVAVLAHPVGVVSLVFVAAF
jgi:hypothetical protein